MEEFAIEQRKDNASLKQRINQNVLSLGRQAYMNEFLPNDFHFAISKRIVLPTERWRARDT